MLLFVFALFVMFEKSVFHEVLCNYCKYFQHSSKFAI